MGYETILDNTDFQRKGGKFLIFFVDDEEYGIEIIKVQEIIGLISVTAVPRVQPYIIGVINLRGKVMPVINLRLRFGMEAVEATDETCIIVTRAKGLEIGILVDRVSEVLDIVSHQIEAAPSFGKEVRTEYLLGIAQTAGRVQHLLDLDKMMATHQHASLASLGADDPNVQVVS